MKSIIIFLIVVIGLFLFSSFTVAPDIEFFTYKKTDKAKIESYKKLKVKTVTGTDKRFSIDINSPDKCFKYIEYYDQNARETQSESINCFDSNNHFFEKYITDCNGNVLEIYKDDKLVVSQEFDSNDNLIEVINYDSDEDEKWKIRYEYDDQNNLLRELRLNFNVTYDTTEFNQYTYLERNDTVLLISKVLQTNNFKEEYLYDSIGRETFYRETDEDGKIWQEKITDYTNMIRKFELYGTDNTLQFRNEIKIDSVGNPLISLSYDQTNSLTGKTIFTYQNGILISKISYYLNGDIDREMLYNNLGQFLCENHYENGILIFRYQCEYFPNSLIKSESTYRFKSNENSCIEWEYEYYD
jgi:hypothetical protein